MSGRAEGAAAAAAILDGFADETGLATDRPPRRYLWTDAFAVCTWLGLHGRTGDPRYLALAKSLVDQVHRVLGRHRSDDPRTGWISGLPEEEGARRPTAGGLRIGKPFPERAADDPEDPRLEWDRDGQYYHYLTRWMHALQRVGEATGEARYHGWAVELARAAHEGFARDTRGSDGKARTALHWKMSVDLSRPLVNAMGAHDPLDGLTACLSLRAGRTAGEEATGTLAGPVAELSDACAGRSWVTDDALGIGGLLLVLHRVARLEAEGRATGPLAAAHLAGDALASLQAFRGSGADRLPADRRLAFRELGLALGLRAVEDLLERGGLGAVGVGPVAVEELRRFVPLARELEELWLEPRHQETPAWRDHADINRVSLAATLVPEGWLG